MKENAKLKLEFVGKSIAVIALVFGIIEYFSLERSKDRAAKVDRSFSLIAAYHERDIARKVHWLRVALLPYTSRFELSDPNDVDDDRYMKVIRGVLFNRRQTSEPPIPNLFGFYEIVQHFEEVLACHDSSVCDPDILLAHYCSPGLFLSKNFSRYFNYHTSVFEDKNFGNGVTSVAARCGSRN